MPRGTASFRSWYTESIAGLNCNGNPLHPTEVIGDKHAEDIRRSIRLANRLGQHRVVTMSGLPGGEPGSTRVNWVVNAWNSAALEVLDYQWEIAAAFWTARKSNVPNVM